MTKKKIKKQPQSKTNLQPNLWKNPSYRNLINPYESKYPQPKAKQK
jgi:hypothetical protein